MAILSVLCIAIDGLDEWRIRFSGTNQNVAYVAFALVSMLSGFLYARSYALPSLMRNPVQQRILLGGLVLFAIALNLLSFSRIERRFSSLQTFGSLGLLPGVLESDLRYQGITDNGNLVDLFNFNPSCQDLKSFFQDYPLRHGGLTNSLILRGEIDGTTNCHGWVFTGGNFLIRSPSVDQILQDNNYRIVDHPIPGDLVVYRNSFDAVLHTGLVQGVLVDRTVIVESKWGVEERFLHRPEDQPYSVHFKYYHSDRGSHLIEIMPTSESDLTSLEND
jgi:hypothetical protein